MFRFNLSTLDNRDIRANVQGFDLILSGVAGQRNNPCFKYLRDVMKAELDRRRDDESLGVVDVELPIGEATPSHLWCLTRFTCRFLQTAAKGQPSAMGLFFAGVVNQIEQSAQRVASSMMN
jgi:hypothetical protein